MNLGAQDAAAARIQELEAEVRRLETEVMQLRIGHCHSFRDLALQMKTYVSTPGFHLKRSSKHSGKRLSPLHPC